MVWFQNNFLYGLFDENKSVYYDIRTKYNIYSILTIDEFL